MKLLSLFLLVGIIIPQVTLAQSPSYLTQADIDEVNRELSYDLLLCAPSTALSVTDPLQRQKNQAWQDSLLLNTTPARNRFQKFTVSLYPKKVNLLLPYVSTWSLRGKTPRPYLIMDRSGISAGPVTLIDYGIRSENGCMVDRQYRIFLEKGTIAQKEAALRKQVKGLPAEADLGSISPLTLGGKVAAVIPTAVEYQGSYILRYDRVLVNLPGGYVLTVLNGVGGEDRINAEMLRIAASASF